MTETLRSLRWYAGLAVVFFGVLPATMVTLLVAGGKTPPAVGYLLIGGIPLILGAVFNAARGMTGGDDPELAASRLRLAMAMVAGADVLLLGGNALLRMTSS